MGIVVVPNATGMVIAALIGLDPVLAVLLNNGSAIAAEMNGFRPLLVTTRTQAEFASTRIVFCGRFAGNNTRKPC